MFVINNLYKIIKFCCMVKKLNFFVSGLRTRYLQLNLNESKVFNLNGSNKYVVKPICLVFKITPNFSLWLVFLTCMNF